MTLADHIPAGKYCCDIDGQSVSTADEHLAHIYDYIRRMAGNPDNAATPWFFILECLPTELRGFAERRDIADDPLLLDVGKRFNLAQEIYEMDETDADTVRGILTGCVADLQYLTIMARNTNYGNIYTFGNEQVGGSRITSLANPNITWEKTGMTNVGIDGTFFNQQLTASVTWFNKKTVDMLVPTVALGTLGQATIPDSNIGEMLNRGWEIEAGFHQNLQSGFYYDLSMNLSFVKNKVLKLYGNNNFISSVYYGRQNQEISRTYEGDPIASFYGWKTDGLYQNMEEIANDPNIANDPRKANITPGDVRFVDMNNDGVIDEGDRTYLGDPNPNTTLGFQAKFGYKGFDLSMNFIGSFGAELYNADRMQGLDPSYSYNMYAETLNRWHGEGTSNSIPKMSTLRTNMNHRTSDLFIENGDYFKLKTMTLGYTFPKKWTDPINIHSLRLFVTAENLFTITSYSGYSPEIGYTDGNKQRGVDYAQYPMSRKFTFGLKVNF